MSGFEPRKNYTYVCTSCGETFEDYAIYKKGPGPWSEKMCATCKTAWIKQKQRERYWKRIGKTPPGYKKLGDKRAGRSKKGKDNDEQATTEKA